ncbi:hypothetical protein BH23PLA1_BH23PLA1_12520 [soil metagenome]
MSLPRSSRGAKGGGRSSASRPAVQRGGSGRGVYVQQPRSDVYVALLGVALGAMILGCLFLALKLNQYEFAVTVS